MTARFEHPRRAPLHPRRARAALSSVDAATPEPRAVIARCPVRSDEFRFAVADVPRPPQSGVRLLSIAPRVGFVRPFMRALAREILAKTPSPRCMVCRHAIGRLSHRFLVPVVDDSLSRIAIAYARRSAFELRAHRGHEPHRPRTESCDRVARSHVGSFDRTTRSPTSRSTSSIARRFVRS